MSTTNRFISPSHGETVNGNTLSAATKQKMTLTQSVIAMTEFELVLIQATYRC